LFVLDQTFASEACLHHLKLQKELLTTLVLLQRSLQMTQTQILHWSFQKQETNRMLEKVMLKCQLKM
jgi:hypothetical protein